MHRCVLLLGLSTALVATQRTPTRRARGIVASTPAEVAIAAQTQLLSLAVVATGEGLWSTVSFGFSAGRALQCLAPPLVASAVIVAASGSVGSGVASDMAPGLAASAAATLALVSSYAARLAEKQEATNAARGAAAKCVGCSPNPKVERLSPFAFASDTFPARQSCAVHHLPSEQPPLMAEWRYSTLVHHTRSRRRAARSASGRGRRRAMPSTG